MDSNLRENNTFIRSLKNIAAKKVKEIIRENNVHRGPLIYKIDQLQIPLSLKKYLANRDL
jgi:hypothetical protein